MPKITALFIIIFTFTACFNTAPGQETPTPIDDADQVIAPNYDLCGSWIWELVNPGDDIFLSTYIGDVVSQTSHNDTFDGMSRGMVTFDNIPPGVTRAVLRFSAEDTVSSREYITSIREVSFDDLDMSFQGTYDQVVDQDPVYYYGEEIHAEFSCDENSSFYIDITELLGDQPRLQIGILLHDQHDPKLISNLALALYFD